MAVWRSCRFSLLPRLLHVTAPAVLAVLPWQLCHLYPITVVMFLGKKKTFLSRLSCTVLVVILGCGLF